MITLIKHTDKVYDFPPIKGVGDFKDPEFRVTIVGERVEKSYTEDMVEYATKSVNHPLCACESLDAAIALVFSYLTNNPGLSCYCHHYYKLTYLGHMENYGRGYHILMDFGDPIHSALITKI